MTDTTFKEFAALAEQGTFVPVCKEVMVDLLTPVSAFLKIAEHSDHAFLLESVEGGEHVARYSFLGKDPFMVLRSRNGRTIVEQGTQREERAEPFMSALRDVMAKYRAPCVPDLPRFTGGAVGFLGYEAAKWFEPSLQRAWEQHAKTGDPESDDAGFMLFDTVLAFDHVKHRILIIANAHVEGDSSLWAQYDFAQAKIRFLERELERSLSEHDVPAGEPVTLRSNTTREVFEQSVRKAQEYIRAGDIYQVVLSQRFESEVSVDPFTVYRTLRYVNPSPYMYFIKVGPLTIVGSSPEMLVRVEGRHAETHPIAGTRPRGQTEEADLQLAEELKQNEKERAEHVMLVDLGRNDLGRVCEFWLREGAAVHGPGAVFARDALGVARGGAAGDGPRSSRCIGRMLSCRDGVRRTQDPRDGDRRGARADDSGDVRRGGRVPRLCRAPRLLHHDSDDRDAGWARLHPGRCRHRG